MSSLENIIKEHPTTMLTKNFCPFCVEAKKIFKELNYDVNIINMEDYPKKDFEELLKEVRLKYFHTTLPVIFYEGKFIGRCDKWKELVKNMKIKKNEENKENIY